MPPGSILYNLEKKADSYATTVKRKSGLLKDSNGHTECLKYQFWEWTTSLLYSTLYYAPHKAIWPKTM